MYAEGSYYLIEYGRKRATINKHNIYTTLDHHIKKYSSNIDNNIDYACNMNNLIYRIFFNNAEVLNKVVKMLSSKEQDILYRYYGFNTHKMTFEEIGKIYHINRSRVRQILLRAIVKIRQNLRFKGYYTIDDINMKEYI